MRLTDRKFYEHFERSPTSGEYVLQRSYCCPCCGYPTVSEPPSYEICALCNWEDDDCDPSGANGDYTLVQASENFRRYLTKHSPTHEFAPQFQRPGFRYVHQEELRTENIERKRRIIAELERYITEADLHRRGEIWQNIQFS